MVEQVASFSGRLDAALLARQLQGPDCLLFERFDLATRQRARSIVGLRWREVQAGDFGSAIRVALAADDPAATHLVFCGADEAARQPVPGFPAFLVLRLDEFIELDHDAGQARHVIAAGGATLSPQVLAALVERTAEAAPAPAPELPAFADLLDTWVPDVDAQAHARRVEDLQREIAQGAIEGAVLSVRLSRRTSAAPLEIYRQMVRINPSTFGFCIVRGSHALVGSSPLAFLDCRDGVVRLETDAGTRPVTGDAGVDAAARRDLLASGKDAAEHAVVVDEEMAALGGIADAAGVHKEVDREVRAFSHVMHLYTVLRARLRPDVDLATAILRLFPPAAVSGRPRRAARLAGSARETGSRGPYGGVLGLLRSGSEAELAVVIRSLWMEDGVATTRVGGKVVEHSVGVEEYQEAMNKARFIVQSVACAERAAP